MEFRSTAKYIKISPRKLILIADLIRNNRPKDAIIMLSRINKRSARPMLDVINSALANAKAKQIDSDKLYFKKIEVLEGPAMKRWRAVSRGQAHAYKKRMSHIFIVLTEKI